MLRIPPTPLLPSSIRAHNLPRLATVSVFRAPSANTFKPSNLVAASQTSTMQNPVKAETSQPDISVRFSQLIADHPSLTMPLVADVLEGCNHDLATAYDLLCQMVIPADIPDETRDTCEAVTGAARSPPDEPSPPQIVAASKPTPIERNDEPPWPSGLLPNANLAAPTGAWANNMGRRLRVEALCRKYVWVEKGVVEALFQKYGECIELVESDILEMFPIDQPMAFAPQSNTRSSREDAERETNGEAVYMRTNAFSKPDDNNNDGPVSREQLRELRVRLWDAREDHRKAHLLYMQTRNKTHHNTAEEKRHELNSMSELYLRLLKQSDAYKRGTVDLHGLTKEEAVGLLEDKIEDCSARFRVIVGRGNHSQGYQSVLKPAIERLLRRHRLAFSYLHDGVISVVKR